MYRFPDVVIEFWRQPFAGKTLYRDDRLSIVTNPDLDEDTRVTVLHTFENNHTAVAVRPEVTKSLAAGGIFDNAVEITEVRLRECLAKIGIVLHGADYIYYMPKEVRDSMRAEPNEVNIRQLTPDDAELFAAFEECATKQDLEDAQINLDDWAVFGAVDEYGGLVSAASTYPWNESKLADIGVLTLTYARGQGHARRLVHTLVRHAISQQHELQYRCQVDNSASIALAGASGLRLFGRWEIPTPNKDDEE